MVPHLGLKSTTHLSRLPESAAGEILRKWLWFSNIFIKKHSDFKRKMVINLGLKVPGQRSSQGGGPKVPLPPLQIWDHGIGDLGCISTLHWTHRKCFGCSECHLRSSGKIFWSQIWSWDNRINGETTKLCEDLCLGTLTLYWKWYWQ